jgi:DNA-binding transcriptional LysR family regulator
LAWILRHLLPRLDDQYKATPHAGSNSLSSLLDNRLLSLNSVEVDLDLAQVRAFVEVAKEGHFGRAARKLFLTQQALSKRIQRLEHVIGEPLFERGPRGVELTASGQHFLPYALQFVDAADAAASAARPEIKPLRVDVWGQLQAPLRMIHGLLEQTPGLSIQLSMRRSLADALTAISHGELDACFGRVHATGEPWPAGLVDQPALLERYAVALSVDHALAGAPVLRPADLTESTMWCAYEGSPAELHDWWRRLAAHLGVQIDTGGRNLGLEHAIDRLRRHPTLFATFGADWPMPADAGIRVIALHPVPCYLWSLAWRETSPHPFLALLRERVVQVGQMDGWLAYDAERDWLPDVDLSLLRGGRLR